MLDGPTRSPELGRLPRAKTAGAATTLAAPSSAASEPQDFCGSPGAVRSTEDRQGINAVLRVASNSRMPEKGDAWAASCEWQEQWFEAVPRNGAANALCRVLVAAGVPDQPMRMVGTDGKPRFTVRSIHEAARWTYKESASEPLRRVLYKEHPRAAGAEGQKSPHVELRGVPGSQHGGTPTFAGAAHEEAA